MKILINDLQKICEKILTKAEESGLSEIDVKFDYYKIFDDLYNLNNDNSELIVGSFVDDWNSLQEVLSGKNPPTTLDVERLGNVLKILSDAIRDSGKVII